MSQYYHKLTEQFSRIHHFNHLAAITGWDQATMMPSGGNSARSSALGELSLHIHHLTTAPEMAEWFANIELSALDEQQQANVVEMRRIWQQAKVLPGELVQAKSLAGSHCEHAWRSQRSRNDWQGFSVNLAEVVNLSREEAAIRADSLGCSRYDALLDLYEPGMTSQQLDRLFGEVKTWLPELIQQVTNKQSNEHYIQPQGPFSIDAQQALGTDIMKLLKFNFAHGRLDVSTHPFCGGVSDDVRITTRYEESDFTKSLMGIIHETGHARYEQGLPATWRGQPAGAARSMGMHESQSLYFEMQLGRSLPFLKLISPLIKTAFNRDNDPAFELDNLHKLYTRVKPGLIRVDADEVTYPAHIMLRYEIEKSLIEGDIEVKDIPEIWDQKMQSYLGISTKNNYKEGCMQDIHWTDGSFGYFPSYTLGAMYAAQFNLKLSSQIGKIDSKIEKGQLTFIFNWLQKHVWQKASMLDCGQILMQATGEKLNATHLKAHLQQRYL